jgi:hypothetical protein
MATPAKGVKHALPTVRSKDMRTAAEIESVVPWVSDRPSDLPPGQRLTVSGAGYDHARTIPLRSPSSTCCCTSHRRLSSHPPPRHPCAGPEGGSLGSSTGRPSRHL